MSPASKFQERKGPIEFLNGFSVEFSGQKLESSLTRVFVRFSTLVFCSTK
jgi:hypothetical protein